MSENIPTNKALYSRVKSEAKQKFDSWPSAYGSAWLVQEYKRRGGTYRKAQDGMEVPEEYMHGGMLYGDSAYMYGGEDTDMVEYAKGGSIPERYKKMGFNKVGVKKKSTRPGKKWMVLAKKGDKYKVVHGGYKGMKDFTQHKNKKRQKRFWDRMGGKDSAKAKDPFSPLYWHKRFGTWEAGGELDEYQTKGEVNTRRESKTFLLNDPVQIERLKRFEEQEWAKQVKETGDNSEEARQQFFMDFNMGPGYDYLNSGAINEPLLESKDEYLQRSLSDWKNAVSTSTNKDSMLQDDTMSRYLQQWLKDNPRKAYQKGGHTFNEDSMDFYKKGGGIHLDPKNKGTFKAAATRMGMSMDDAAEEILSAKEGKYSPTLRRKANFYKNFVMQGGGAVFNEDSQDFYAYGGGTNNPGFKALPPKVQQNILDNMGIGGECYACGGQKKYQFAGQTFEDPFTAEEKAFMQPSAPTMLDEVVVNDTRIGGPQPKPLPRFDVFVPPVVGPDALTPMDVPEVVNEEDSKNNNRLLWAMGRIGLANAANSMMNFNAAQKQQAQMRSNNLTDNFIPLDAPTDRGDYDINTGIFRPNDYVPVQFQAQYQSGGQIGMVDDELLKELIAAGADIELLD